MQHGVEVRDSTATNLAVEGLVVLGEKYENVVALGGDITGSVMTSYFKEKFPERFFSMGITASGTSSKSMLSTRQLP